MKNYSTDLMNMLKANLSMYKVDLFAIGPCQNGEFIYACNGSGPITFGGNVYERQKFGAWARGDVVVKIGLDSNGSKLTVFADNNLPVYFPGTSNSVLLMDGIKYGLLGDAPVTIYTAYMPLTQAVGGLTIDGYGVVIGPTGGSLVEKKFVGMVTNIENAGMTRATINVQDMLYLLNIQVPRKVFQASCSNVLYDGVCSLTASSFSRAGTVGTITYPYLFATTANLTPHTGSGTFTLGYLTWTTGNNAGLASFVRQWTPGSGTDQIQLDVQPIFPIQAGDTFTVYQGCNKTFASCTDLQGSTNSYLRYGGQPVTPVPETAIG